MPKTEPAEEGEIKELQLSDSESSSLSSDEHEEDTQMSAVGSEQSEEHADKISLALSKLVCPTLTEKMAHILKNNPETTVTELAEVESQVYYRFAIAGKTEELLLQQAQDTEKLEQDHNQLAAKFAVLQENFGQLESKHAKLLEATNLEDSIKAKRKELEALCAKTAHLDAVRQTELLCKQIDKLQTTLEEKQAKISETDKNLVATTKQFHKIERKLKKIKASLQTAQQEAKKFQRKKAEYLGQLQRYEKGILSFAADLHLIENRMRMFDVLCGRERQITSLAWGEYDTERSKYDALRYDDCLKTICGKSNTNKARHQAKTRPFDLSAYDDRLPDPSSAAETFVFKTKRVEKQVEPTLLPHPKKALQKGKSQQKKQTRKRKISTTVQQGAAVDPRGKKRVKTTSTKKVLTQPATRKMKKMKKPTKPAAWKPLTQPAKGAWI